MKLRYSGIKKPLLPSIFDKFAQVHPALQWGEVKGCGDHTFPATGFGDPRLLMQRQALLVVAPIGGLGGYR